MQTTAMMMKCAAGLLTRLNLKKFPSDQVEVADWTTSEFIRDHMDDVKGYYELQQKSFVESGDCEETPVDNYVLFDVMEEACAE
ncbi:MAG: hypothetical protein ACLUGJ_08950 [Blautia wexlerae]